MLHSLAVVITLLEFSLLLHFSDALQCLEGFTITRVPAPESNANQTWSEVECSTDRPHSCMRGELVIQQSQEPGASEDRLGGVGCVPSNVCNFPCEKAFRALNVPFQRSSTAFVSHCEVACCDSDNCNDNSTEETSDVEVREFRSAPFFFYSLEIPQNYFGIRNTLAYIVDSDGESFRLVSPGLAGTPGSVSFLSTSQDNHYLRHQDGIIKLHPRIDQQLYNEDATFMPRYNLYYKGYAAFESVNFRRHFIRRLANNQLWINPFQNTDEYKRSVSFKSVKSTTSRSPPLKIHTLDEPDKCFGRIEGSVDNRTMLVDCDGPDGDSYIVVSPGLRGTPGSVSFQSESDFDYYLRLEDVDEGYLKLDRIEDNLAYKSAVTFVPRKSGMYPGYTSFKSVLHANSHVYQTRKRRLSSLNVRTERDVGLARKLLFALIPN